LHVI